MLDSGIMLYDWMENNVFPIGRLVDKRFFKPVEGHERIWGNIARGRH